MDTLFLNAPDISIKSILLNGAPVGFSTDSNGVIIRFLQAINWNKEYTLNIDYEATPRKGLYFIGWDVKDKPNGNRYFTRQQIWTQGQGIDNRYWFPCYDDVNDKMITETYITFDSAFTVVSNGVLKEKKKNTDGTFTWHYAMNKPMVPYLVMIAIDKYGYKDFKSKSGVSSRQYFYTDRPETAEPTYEHSGDMMDWLQEQTGIKYPWQTYANVPVQDFMYGAMENTTATVYGDFYLNTARENIERAYLGTNAHELTHQWFGDYITEYSAQHHWLHESFATYYSKQFVHSIQGENAYEWTKRNEVYAAISADRNDRFPIAHSHGGSPRVYPKGSFVIDMIRYVVGDSVYKKCVTEYLKKHAYANVSNHDFQFAFMETAGVNLDWFFDEWVYRSGVPHYEIAAARQEEQVMFVVKQTHKTDELTGYFKMPLVFEVHFTDGSSSSKKQWLTGPIDTVYVSAPKGKQIEYTLFDPAGNVLKTVTYSKPLKELIAQATKAAHMIDRYDALLALRDTSFEKKRETLALIFGNESYYVIKTEIVSQLAKDTAALNIQLLKNALHDKSHLVRRSVIENADEIPAALLKDVEGLLNDSSYITIEIALRKLCRLYPEKANIYLQRVKNIYGINNNVRLAYLELSEKNHAPDGNILELTNYASNCYEFRTRVRAIEAIERLNYCNETVIQNLFNARLFTNNRLNSPATKALKLLLSVPQNMTIAKAVFEAGKWQEWERKILQETLAAK
jgi:aminopeptidase N